MPDGPPMGFKARFGTAAVEVCLELSICGRAHNASSASSWTGNGGTVRRIASAEEWAEYGPDESPCTTEVRLTSAIINLLRRDRTFTTSEHFVRGEQMMRSTLQARKPLRARDRSRLVRLDVHRPPRTGAALKGRALDNWRLGEGSRIMTYLQPKKYRPMSLYGEVFQGKWNTDWHDVSHITQLRAQYSWAKDNIQQGPELLVCAMVNDVQRLVVRLKLRSVSSVSKASRSALEGVHVLLVNIKFESVDHKKKFKQLWSNIAKEVKEKEAKCLSYEFCDHFDDPTKAIIYERYVTKEDLDGPHQKTLGNWKATYGEALGQLNFEMELINYVESNVGQILKRSSASRIGTS
ncbi:unnamed protein product [Cladocopium goreaui]|uniref:ABM domain-containing protein n=1 Tax=Cladocopium goreaui TaxID=2562237 RepID=A0A9P1C1Z8_9DINO|nr:unnamed protein product [Cladocopium goreaui]